MGYGMLLVGTRSLAIGLSTLSFFPGNPPKPMSQSRFRLLTPAENARKDCEAIAGDWRRIGEDIRNAAEKVMARKV